MPGVADGQTTNPKLRIVQFNFSGRTERMILVATGREEGLQISFVDTCE
jgi:hypothetical protein